MDDKYYREKVLGLIDKIFIETGDARSRIINCEDKIRSAQTASNSSGVPDNIKKRWKDIWNEINSEPELLDHEGHVIHSSLKSTVTKKKNKSIEKHLHFFLEEFYRVI